jgi:hypothetical protein
MQKIVTPSNTDQVQSISCAQAKTETKPTKIETKSISFIRTNQEEWFIPETGSIPTIMDSIPVVSVIGTSRDGKSTSLNLYANWLINKLNFKSGFESDFHPFNSSQSDSIVTNGIDWFEIPNGAMLIDCQGMQLADAKHDHYLMLITYLFSNLIILTVRERLDLQVLNNCLGVFSFLSEIPDQYKRVDKPILLIRIKDFPSKNKLNGDYLQGLVSTWLKKSHDQYDQIKEAFANCFDIKITATLHPVGINDDGEIDIHDPQFLQQNPSWNDFCSLIWSLSKDQIRPNILASGEEIKMLCDQLKINKTIDWTKLDLYHQIKENELRKYLQDELGGDPFNDKTIWDLMDGTINAELLYKTRDKLIQTTKHKVYMEKFKDVPPSIKAEVFDHKFNSMDQIVQTARSMNHLAATKNISQAEHQYLSAFETNTDWDNFCSNILEFMNKVANNFITELKLVDSEIYNRWIEIIDRDKVELASLALEISSLNKTHMKNICEKIQSYDPNQMLLINTKKYLTEIIMDKKIYSEPIDQSISNIIKPINTSICEIFQSNDLTYHLDQKKQIVSSSSHLKYDPNDWHIDPFTNSEYIDYFWETKAEIFSSMGIIQDTGYLFDLSTNPFINWIHIVCESWSFLLTKRRFETAINSEKLLCVQKYPVGIIKIIQCSNLTQYQLVLNPILNIDTVGSEPKINFRKFYQTRLEELFGINLGKYLIANNFKYSSIRVKI